jgi:undecaprenyl-diphosphatase
VRLVQAALLGIVQGVTEFLPVSSTAHLRLAERWLGFPDPGGVFTVVIQFGSILALLWLYRAKIAAVVAGLGAGDPDARRFTVMILAAFIPAAIAGLLLEHFIKEVLYASVRVIAVAFIAGGVVMLLVERFRPRPTIENAEHTPWPRAVGIGLWQTLALIPGVSRSGATIVGALTLGLDRAAAAEFSFFLAMPTLGAAAAHDLWQVRHALTSAQAAEIGVGLFMAFIASAVVVRPFLRFVGRSGFGPFAWYRIIVGLALLAALYRASLPAA